MEPTVIKELTLPSLPLPPEWSPIELRLSNLLESSSKTLFLANSLCTMGEGCAGLRSKENFGTAELAAEEEALPELTVLGVVSLADTDDPTFKVGSTEVGPAAADPGVAGVCPGVFLLTAEDPDHFSYFSSKAFSLSSKVIVEGS